MDTSSLPLLNYDLQYQWCSDSDLSSISSPESLSPVHSMDSSLSPSDQRPAQSTPRKAKSGYSPSLGSSPHSLSGRGRKSGRAPRIRSKQRQSASEKEKLRMRVLTKAMHHLRSYLPPSVAPAGQTLTKIETLRLTIRYISFLSAQLGLSEEVLFQQRREQGDPSASDTSSPDIHSYLQAGNTGGPEPQLQNQSPGQSLYPEQRYNHNAMVHHGSCSFRVDQYNGHYSGAAQGDVSVDAILQSPPSTQASYQVRHHELLLVFFLFLFFFLLLHLHFCHICTNANACPVFSSTDVWTRLQPPVSLERLLVLRKTTDSNNRHRLLQSSYCLTVNPIIYL